MLSRVLLLVLGVAHGLQLPAAVRPQGRAAAAARAAVPQLGLFDMVTGNLKQTARNLQQIADQRLARASIILIPCGTPITAAEAIAQLEGWKAEIGDDRYKFAECARANSLCKDTADKGGLLLPIFRGQLAPQLEDVIFNEEIGKCYGPIATKQGLHLIYLHWVGEPKDGDGREKLIPKVSEDADDA